MYRTEIRTDVKTVYPATNTVCRVYNKGHGTSQTLHGFFNVHHPKTDNIFLTYKMCNMEINT